MFLLIVIIILIAIGIKLDPASGLWGIEVGTYLLLTIPMVALLYLFKGDKYFLECLIPYSALCSFSLLLVSIPPESLLRFSVVDIIAGIILAGTIISAFHCVAVLLLSMSLYLIKTIFHKLFVF